MPSEAAKWLLALPPGKFMAIVAQDCAATLDEEAASALRETIVLSRWLWAVDEMLKSQRPRGESGPSPLTERRAEAVRLLATQARDPDACARDRQAAGSARTADRRAAQRQAGRAGTSNGARRRAAGAIAVEQLIKAHPEEFAGLLAEAHAQLDTPGEEQLRVRRLVAAGLAWSAAADFTERKWPEGQLSDGIYLAVADDEDLTARGKEKRPCTRGSRAAGGWEPGKTRTAPGRPVRGMPVNRLGPRRRCRSVQSGGVRPPARYPRRDEPHGTQTTG